MADGPYAIERAMTMLDSGANERKCWVPIVELGARHAHHALEKYFERTEPVAGLYRVVGPELNYFEEFVVEVESVARIRYMRDVPALEETESQ